MQRAYYSNSIKDYQSDNTNAILGELTKHHNHALENLQRNAWIEQIQILKQNLSSYDDGHIFFEFSIPRMGKRVDNIVIIDDSIFILEFKIRSSVYDKSAIEQVLAYALDLKNFHEGSHHEKLFPILIATEAGSKNNTIENLQDALYKPLLANKDNLSEIIDNCLKLIKRQKLCPVTWKSSMYKPTPTIIQAAQA